MVQRKWMFWHWLSRVVEMMATHPLMQPTLSVSR